MHASNFMLNKFCHSQVMLTFDTTQMAKLYILTIRHTDMLPWKHDVIHHHQQKQSIPAVYTLYLPSTLHNRQHSRQKKYLRTMC